MKIKNLIICFYEIKYGFERKTGWEATMLSSLGSPSRKTNARILSSFKWNQIITTSGSVLKDESGAFFDFTLTGGGALNIS